MSADDHGKPIKKRIRVSHCHFMDTGEHASPLLEQVRIAPDKQPSRKRSNMEIPLEEGPFFWKFPASPAIRGRED